MKNHLKKIFNDSNDFHITNSKELIEGKRKEWKKIDIDNSVLQLFIPRTLNTSYEIFICFTTHRGIINNIPTSFTKIPSKCSTLFPSFSRTIHIFPTILHFITYYQSLPQKIIINVEVF